MAVEGLATVIMWHDIAPEADGAYNLWHTREHMPERIALPGFRRARRGVNKGLTRQHYFTLYECDNLANVISPEYKRSLNFPTSWTQQVAPTFRNFARMSCEWASTSGQGIGGAVATFRGSLPTGTDEASLAAALASVTEPILALASVTGVHLAFARPGHTNGDTKEVQIRPAMAEPDFDAVVVVEGIGLTELGTDQEAIRALLAPTGLGDVIAQTYDVAFVLDKASAA